MVRLLDPLTMAASDWPAASPPLRAFAEAFARQGSARFVSNLETQLAILRTGDLALPVTINSTEYTNSYVCSPYTAYALYAKEELRLLPSKWARRSLAYLADITGAVLKAARINETIHVNNWMLSTNLFPHRTDLPFAQITASLISAYPRHFLCVRSLNASANADLMRDLAHAGYWFLASRQVYLFDDLARTWATTSNAHHDRRLLRKTPYRVIEHDAFSDADFSRMAELYRLLYIEKYSALNPSFTTEYLRLCHLSGVMTFIGLRSPDGVLDGVLGLFVVEGTLTAPIVGYDTRLSPKHGLYRLLMTLVFETALEKSLRVNLSSGAASFKRLRGGQPCIEYSAVYDRHLSLGRRTAAKSLAAIVNGLGIPLMRALKL